MFSGMFSGDDISVEDAAKLYDETYCTAMVKSGYSPDVDTCKKIEELAFLLQCRREDVENFVRDFQFIGVAENAQNLQDAKCGEKCSCLRNMYLQHRQENLAIRKRVSELTDAAEPSTFVPKRKTPAGYKKCGRIGISTKNLSSSEYTMDLATKLVQQHGICMEAICNLTNTSRNYWYKGEQEARIFRVRAAHDATGNSLGSDSDEDGCSNDGLIPPDEIPNTCC